MHHHRGEDADTEPDRDDEYAEHDGADTAPIWARRGRAPAARLLFAYRSDLIGAAASRLERQDLAARGAKPRLAMIRVPIPIDVGMVVSTGSGSFALATPLRVDALIALAINEALGPRAPQDKRDRTLRATFKGLADGKFRVAIDGRFFDRIDDVVMCAGTATLRFFLQPSVHAPR
jgi:hypothetical protein